MTRKAFTLVETIATIVIVGMVVGIAAPVISAGIGGYASAATRAELGAAASAALERIVSEMQEMPLQSGATTVDPAIVSITASSITWSTNSSLSLSGSNLQLVKSGGTARTLLKNVQTFSVQAYDQSNTALASSLSGSACDAVRRLRFSVTVSMGSGSSLITETMRTRVFLRCTMAGAEP